MIDGDIYGPNVPIMLGLQTQLSTDGQKIVPAEQYGIQVVSMGFLTGDDAPVIWRGPMLHGVIQQFFREVRWDRIDYLIVDMPPGTGDVALSLSQTVPVSGAVVVTTPADGVARRHAARGAHVSEAQRPDARPGREHEPLRLPRLPDGERHLRQGRRRDARRATCRCRSLAGCRSTSRFASAATPACRSRSASRSRRPRARSARRPSSWRRSCRSRATSGRFR